MSLKDIPKHKRPREKMLLQGPENLKNEELLAILLRTGTRGKSAIAMGKDILKHIPIERLLEIELADLKSIKGIDLGKATTIIAAIEITKRSLQSYEVDLPLITSAEAAVDQVTEIRKLKKEHFVCLYLNARNQLVHKETISVGTVDASIAHPRDIFEPAIRYMASRVILFHNHPSGGAKPSKQDIELTERILESGEILDIEVCDHIIVTPRTFFSFAREGLIVS